MKLARSLRRLVVLCLGVAAVLLGGAGSVLLGNCGPFTDVAADAFCPFVLEIFYLGITTGLTPTTYDPASPVTRLQMAAFLSRTVDRTLQRGSRRASLNQFWVTRANVATTTLGQTTVNAPTFVKADGADVWVSSAPIDTVQRVRASDGKLLDTWTGAAGASDVLAAMGQIFVGGFTTPGQLYWIDPGKTAGAVTVVASNLGNGVSSLAFDGSRIWSANDSGSVSIVTPGNAIPWTVTTVPGFFFSDGIVFDGSNMWVTNNSAGTLQKLGGNGAVLQTVTVGLDPLYPVFDGTSIWVPNNGSNSVSVVRASNGAVLATLTGNGLDNPLLAAFDGERVLVTNQVGDAVSVFKAADLTPRGIFSTGTASSPHGACSDGVNFWIALSTKGRLLRF